MAAITLNSSSFATLKVALRAELPNVKSSHLSEAIAHSLSFRTHASLLASVAAPRHSPLLIDQHGLLSRLRAFGYSVNDDVDVELVLLKRISGEKLNEFIFQEPRTLFLVRVTSISGDADTLKSILKTNGYELVNRKRNESSQIYLSHPKYRSFGTTSDVYADAKRLHSALRQFSEVEHSDLGLEVGSVETCHSDGKVSQHIFAEGHLMSAASVIVAGTVTVTRNTAISEVEHQRVVSEAAARNASIQKESLIRRAGVALAEKNALKVRTLLAVSNPSAVQLGNIIELVEEACNGQMDKFTTKAELKRFNHSINHPEVFGLDARHAVVTNQPPSKPMARSEASEFAHGVAKCWLESMYQAGLQEE